MSAGVLPPPEAPLAFRLFGGFAVSRHGAPLAVPFGTVKDRSLFAFLLLNADTYHSRAVLAELFWPEAKNADRASGSLRGALTSLRKAIEACGVAAGDLLPRSGAQIRLVLPADWWVDVLEFRRLLRESDRHPLYSREWLQNREAAARVYSAELFPEAIDNWFLLEREALQREYADCLRALTRAGEAEQRYPEAASWALRAVALDALDEASQRALMRIYFQMGERARAERQYHQLRDALAEVGEVPDAETLELYQQIVSHTRSRAPVSEPRGTRQPEPLLAPLVGREAERQQMTQAWQRARSGRGGLVLLRGEPGIGKTRLCRQLLQEAGFDHGAVLSGQAYPNEGGYLYRPLVSILRRGLEVAAEQGVPIQDAHWLPHVERLAASGLGRVESRPLEAVAGSEALLQGLTEFFLALAAQRPVCIFVDDLHWADPATGEFLRFFFRRIHASRILLVGTYRDGQVADSPWLLAWVRETEARGPVLSLRLDRLSEAEVNLLLAQIAGDRASEGLVRPLGHRLYQETEGNPFFLVALLEILFAEGILAEDEDGQWRIDPTRVIDQTAVDHPSENGAIPSLIGRLPIPTTSKRLVEQRLERLTAPEREMIESAAVLGRRFPFRVLQEVVGWDTTTTLEGVERLLKEDLIEAQAQMSALDFRHGQIREVVYHGLTETRRRQLHWQVGEALERIHAVSAARDVQDARFPDWFRSPPATPERARAEQRAPELALHFEQAAPIIGPEKAVRYHHLAGVRARYLSAYQQAIDHLEKGLSLLDDLPDDPERLAQRGLLVEQLAPALFALGQRELAIDLLKGTIDRCEEHGYGLGIARVWTLLGHGLEIDSTSVPGLTRPAAYERAVAACHSYGIEEEALEPRSLLALALVWDGLDLERARTVAQGCLAAAESRRDTPLVRRLHTVLLWYAARQRDWDGVREAFRASLNWGGPSAPMLKVILEGIESDCRRHGDTATFPSLCDEMRASYQAAALPLPFEQWYLAPTTSCPDPRGIVIGDSFPAALQRGALVWQDATGESGLDTTGRPGWLGISPAAGCDLWPDHDLRAPRVMARLEAVPGVEAVVAMTQVELGAGEGMQAGLLFWSDERNFIRLEMRSHAAPEPTVCMEACIASRFQLIGRGQSGTRSIWLRIEYADGMARGLCSADGKEWLLCGSVRFPLEGEYHVGVSASCPEESAGAAWFASLAVWRDSAAPGWEGTRPVAIERSR
jgi:DNA-binding SARP family transcriptional activator